MRCLRPILFSAVFILVTAGLTGCFPSSDNNLDEEKDPHFQRGRDLVNSQEFKAAVDEFEKALETNPRSAAAHYELGCLEDNKTEDYAAAIYHYQRYLALAPKSPRAQRVMDRIRGCKLELASTEFALPNSQSLQQEVETLTQKNLLLQEQLDAARNAAAASAVLPSPPAPPAQIPANPVLPRAFAPAQPPPVPAVADAARPRVYVIQSHDTITSIATRYGLKPSLVLAANPNIDPTRLRIGQSLNLP
ncbi:MAG: LysM peptidoglycan-binding domain-containing protein [Verrucomicrobiota bacterium]|jgi:tetratricopeptide (TPR) repeat protein